MRPRPGLAWYSGSKGAAVTLTKSMAIELAPDKIRVNALCPVAGDTPLLVQFMGVDIQFDHAKRGELPFGIQMLTPALCGGRQGSGVGRNRRSVFGKQGHALACR